MSLESHPERKEDHLAQYLVTVLLDYKPMVKDLPTLGHN